MTERLSLLEGLRSSQGVLVVKNLPACAGDASIFLSFCVFVSIALSNEAGKARGLGLVASEHSS